MENKKSTNNTNDIQEAQREYLNNKKFGIVKIILFLAPLLLLLTPFLLLRYQKVLAYISSNITSDKKLLGHLPYEEISNNNLVEIQPNILVHKDMYASLLKMKSDAENDGIFLTFLSGYRSFKLQEEIFYTLKAARNQIAIERAKVSAPPGYSEHSTGFAIDIGDAQNRNTDFEVEFEDTRAFKWLKRNAAKYHFRLSFDKNHKYVDYEPWHWRYEGSIDSLKIFEQANREINFF